MAHLNTRQLVTQATGVAARANAVIEDPAVQKSWTEAFADLGQAKRSMGRALDETKAAWQRSGDN